MAESYQNPNFENTNYYPAPPIQELRVGFGKRLGAWVLDILLVALLAGIFSNVFPIRETEFWKNMEIKMEEEMEKQQSQMGREFTEEEEQMGIYWGEMMALLIIFFYPVRLLLSSIELFTGASPAKHMLGITIANPNGNPASLPLKAARWFISYSAVLLIVLGIITQIDMIGTVGYWLGALIIIGCFFALGEEKQALHDKIAKTAIFNKEDIANMQVQPVATPAM